MSGKDSVPELEEETLLLEELGTSEEGWLLDADDPELIEEDKEAELDELLPPEKGGLVLSETKDWLCPTFVPEETSEE